MIVTAVKSSTPRHSVSTALQGCVRSSADRCFHDASLAFRRLSGLASADAIESFVFLAFTDVEISFRLSSILNGHRSFCSCRSGALIVNES